MSVVGHRGHGPPSLNESDFSLDHHVDGDADGDADVMNGSRHGPLKSTLLVSQVPGGRDARRARQARSRIPNALMFRGGQANAGSAGPAQRETHAARYPTSASIHRPREDDATLSTQHSDSILDAVPAHHLAQSRHQHEMPTVSRQHSMPSSSVFDQDRRTMARSSQRNDFDEHPSPSSVARQHKLRGGKLSGAPPNNLALSDSDDSESAAESSSSSDTIDVATRKDAKFRQSLGESTGNHQGFMRSLAGFHNDAKPGKRPTLAPGWQDHLDGVNDGLRKAPSRQSSMPALHRAKSAYDDGQEKRSISPRRPSGRYDGAEEVDALEAGSNESGYAAGSQRKASNASSKSKLRSGTDASTSGETMVDGPAGPLASHFRLPSGQRMGKGVPSSGFSLPADLSGLTMALESPVKTRLGVEHREIVPEEIHAYAAATSDVRMHDLEGVADFIRTVNEKADRANDVSRDAVREVGSLRKEWSSWRDGNHNEKRRNTKPSRVAPMEEHHPAFEANDAKQYRSKLVNAHKMATEIGESMESYRATLAELKREEEELLAREYQRSHATAHMPARRMHEAAPSLPTAARVGDDDDDDDDVESLRAQVEAVAREVERLRNIVNRQADQKRVYSASSPIKPPSRRNGSGLQNGNAGGNPFVQHRKVSGGSQADRAASNQRPSSPSHAVPHSLPTLATLVDSAGVSHDRGGPGNDELGDETARPQASSDPVNVLDEQLHAVDARARHAIEKVMRAGDASHDVQQCSHCARHGQHTHRHKSYYRNAAVQHESNGRNAKPHRSSSGSERRDDEREARTLLEEALHELENYVGAHLPPALVLLANKQRALLERTIRDELDDFFHARETYGQMADELKTISPDMSAANRRVLSNHVYVSITELESRATRIDRLRAALAATLPGSFVDDDAVPAGRPAGPPRSKAGSHSRHDQRMRNSPPIVDDEDNDEPRVGSYDAYYRRGGLQ